MSSQPVKRPAPASGRVVVTRPHTQQVPHHFELSNAIRALSMDAVQAARSGHPGMPMGMADIATVLWREFLQHDPSRPQWPNRDRFVLSNGHGSMLLYSLLHLSGYDLSIDELRNFRQLHQRTPGHPEYGMTPGVETTTGPLGQGFANAVGMALAEKVLATKFNRSRFPIIDHYTYVFLGDGCLMEGISHESASLAGRLGLGKLIACYDDNGISIDGCVRGWFSDDTPMRFRAYGWHVIDEVDGHDPQALREAIRESREQNDTPSMICCKTVIGRGAPNKQGSASTHGGPLGESEVAQTREALGWNEPPFMVPKAIQQAWLATRQGRTVRERWEKMLALYGKKHPNLHSELLRRLTGELPIGFSEEAAEFIYRCQQSGESIATRQASGQCLEHYGPLLPELIGGSADLSSSNNTRWSGSNVVTNGERNGGNYIHFGAREFGMTTTLNGLALHGGFLPYGGTFLVFSDYTRSAVRMAAMMGCRCALIYTHDSIALGEDGPTHQPVEHLAMLRATPNISTWRPCDLVETAAAWRATVERHEGPTALVLTRQALPLQARTKSQVEAVAQGGYTLWEPPGEGLPEALVIATGSEVPLAIAAAQAMAERKKPRRVRVVSMPSTDVFDSQSEDYREMVLPAAVTRRLVVEAGSSFGWHKYAGNSGHIIAIDRFGASGPGAEVLEHFGFSVKAVTAQLRQLLAA